MKKLTQLLGICVIFMACNKSDVPSLDEQKEGRWRIKSYTEERYNPATNMVSRHETQCGQGDYMDFAYERVAVHFDSTADQQWSCAIVDYKTLKIEGKRWDIVQLNPQNFQLSLFDRDSLRKHREVVWFELTRP